jgi:hypothetical protein
MGEWGGYYYQVPLCDEDPAHPLTPPTRIVKPRVSPKNNASPCVSFANNEEGKDSKSPSKSPLLKKKTRQPPAMSSVDSDNDEDEEVKKATDQYVIPGDCLQTKNSNVTMTKTKMAYPVRDVSQSASPTIMTCVTPAHDNLVTDEVMAYITNLEERNEWLNEHVVDLNRNSVNLVSGVEILTAVIVRLKAKLVATENEDDEGKHKKDSASTKEESIVCMMRMLNSLRNC